MGVVWAVWWFVCVRKCSRNLKALPYLSTRYRQVVPAQSVRFVVLLLPSAFRSHFDSSAAVFLFLRMAQPVARAVHDGLKRLRLDTAPITIHLRFVP